MFYNLVLLEITINDQLWSILTIKIPQVALFFLLPLCFGRQMPKSLTYSATSHNLCCLLPGGVGLEAVNNGNFPSPAE